MATANNAAAIGCEQYSEEYFSVDLGDGVCWVGILRSRWYRMAMFWSVALALAWIGFSSSGCKHFLCLCSSPCLFIDWKVASEDTAIGASCQAIGSLKSLSRNLNLHPLRMDLTV